MDKNNTLIIGNGVVCNASKEQFTRLNVCGGTSLTIGDKCLLSNNIQIHTTDYHKIFQDEFLQNSPMPVEIGRHCWIGLSAIILKGVKIGAESIVGAGSVVTKACIKENCVLAGNPAKEIKNNIHWQE